jgi:hypothetical protein
MNISQLKQFAINSIKENPNLKDQIVSLYQLALDEVEEGGSEEHECQLAERDILDLINDK